MDNNTGCINNKGLLQMKYKNANQHSLVQVQGAKTLPYSFHTTYLRGMYSRLSLLISLVKYSNSSLSLYWCSALLSWPRVFLLYVRHTYIAIVCYFYCFGKENYNIPICTEQVNKTSQTFNQEGSFPYSQYLPVREL